MAILYKTESDLTFGLAAALLDLAIDSGKQDTLYG